MNSGPSSEPRTIQSTGEKQTHAAKLGEAEQTIEKLQDALQQIQERAVSTALDQLVDAVGLKAA